MIYFNKRKERAAFSRDEMQTALFASLGKMGKRKKVLAVPPDITRYHSRAGMITDLVSEFYGERLTDVLPAIGTHTPMTGEEIEHMYPGTPKQLFRVHDWRNNLDELGRVPSSFIKEVSESKLDYDWPAQVDSLLSTGGHDLILSIGQVVPHEVIGMANYNKNIFIGTGGSEAINKSHFLGAVFGMERMMGRADTPVRRVLNYASDHFADKLPIVYVLTVIGRGSDGELGVKGLYIGDDSECFNKAAAHSLEENFTLLENPLDKVVVYLQPDEFRSTWLGNKSVYRTRMAIADGGELIVLAPGIKEFGEDREIDSLIRKYGYTGSEELLNAVRENSDLQGNLSAAAHMIHGSSEGRFSITYCCGKLSKEEVEGANYRFADYGEAVKRYPPESLKDGKNILPGGEEIYFISNPALGLWSSKDRFS